MADFTPCSVEGCERPRYARQDLCEAHYRRKRRTGSLDASRPIGAVVVKPCMVECCPNTSTGRGLCHGHYLRLIRLGDVQAERPLDRRVNGMCVVAECENKATARGLCSTHRARLRTSGDVRADTPVKKVEGTGSISHGYRMVPVPRELRHLVQNRRTELEHRLVMAQMLGRPLTADESVHHRNGDRLDNQPENLELWSRYQPRGQRVSDKLEYAFELIRRYLPDDALAAQLSLTSERVPPTGFEPVPPP